MGTAKPTDCIPLASVNDPNDGHKKTESMIGRTEKSEPLLSAISRGSPTGNLTVTCTGRPSRSAWRPSPRWSTIGAAAAPGIGMIIGGDGDGARVESALADTRGRPYPESRSGRQHFSSTAEQAWRLL